MPYEGDRWEKNKNSVLNLKALVDAFNQEKALVGAFSVIVKLMEHYTALVRSSLLVLLLLN